MDQYAKAFTGNFSDVDLRLLRVFRLVVQSQGFAGAEVALGAGKSTISKHISDLEGRLGVCLCRRGRAGFALTPAGEKIHDAAQQLFASLDEFKSKVNSVHARLDGPLSVAVADMALSDGRSPLAATLAAFRSNAPDVHLHLAVAGATDIERGMLDGTFNVGVIVARNPHRSLVYQPLHHERSFLYCSSRHPLFVEAERGESAAPLVSAAFAMRSYTEEEQELVERGVLARAATADNSDAIAALILTGEFIGFLPERYAWPWEKRGTMRALQPHRLSYRINFMAVTRKGVPMSPAVECFLEELCKASQPPTQVIESYQEFSRGRKSQPQLNSVLAA